MHSAGQFDAEVLDHGITKSNTGTSQVAVKFQTDEGTITGWFALTDKSAKYTIEKVRNIGFTGTDLQELNDGKCCVGNRCSIQVFHDEYPKGSGTMKAKVGFVNPEGYEGGEIARDDGAAANARKFNALLRKAPVTAAAKANDDTPPPPTDDDIPF